MVLLQDWASDDFLIKPVRPDIADCGHDPSNVTNVRLKALLRTHFGLEFEDIYATNVFPFIKPGGMSGAIKAADFGRAMREFAIPQLEIVAVAAGDLSGADDVQHVRPRPPGSAPPARSPVPSPSPSGSAPPKCGRKRIPAALELLAEALSRWMTTGSTWPRRRRPGDDLEPQTLKLPRRPPRARRHHRTRHSLDVRHRDARIYGRRPRLPWSRRTGCQSQADSSARVGIRSAIKTPHVPCGRTPALLASRLRGSLTRAPPYFALLGCLAAWMPQRQCPEACRRPTWRIHAGVDAAAPGSYSADSGPGSGADPAAPRPQTGPWAISLRSSMETIATRRCPSIHCETKRLLSSTKVLFGVTARAHLTRSSVGDCQPERRRPLVAPNVLAAHSGKQRRCVARAGGPLRGAGLADIQQLR